jgi:hypothetical protein
MNSTFTNSFNKAKSAAQSGMNGVRSAVQNGMNGAVAVASSAGNHMVSIMYSTAGGMQSAGYYAGAGFASGLAGSAGYIYAVAAGIAARVTATIRRALSIHSPSRVMKKLGGFTGEGFAIGMSKWVDEINDISKQYAMAVTEQNWAVRSSMVVAGDFSTSGLSSSLDDLADEVKNSELSQPVFDVHNELIGDKIYTTVKEREAREDAKNDYFNY